MAVALACSFHGNSFGDFFFCFCGPRLCGKPTLNSALADYEAAASAETGLVASREKMALVMAQLGRSDESIQVLRQVVRKYPAYAEAHAALAAVLWGARHDYLGAEDQWARIQNDDMRDQLSDRETLRGYLRWPPRMIQYLNDFLNLRTASGEIESAGFVP
ncbi:hypothetical protein F1559_001625 [Cyanidiococcus yangmingshanensis]|uniref:Tetratricopeptide repeat protein n=1 Tax=Cyanidiococcus yangmingshanensis TaxID=2690220 RepID=A0A7J7IH22_9RHOD|nr:hypothetical protein F1559_001625 [Cyanidiococcus yangmingshanensis]